MGRHEGFSRATSRHADSAKPLVAGTIGHQREPTSSAWKELITRRSRVQILPPLRTENPGFAWVFCVSSQEFSVGAGPFHPISAQSGDSAPRSGLADAARHPVRCSASNSPLLQAKGLSCVDVEISLCTTMFHRYATRMPQIESH